MRDSELSMNIPLFKDIPHVGSFWHLLIINLYFYIRLFDSWECHFWYPGTILSSNIARGTTDPRVEFSLPKYHNQDSTSWLCKYHFQRQNVDQTPAQKSCLNFNFKTLTKPCVQSLNQSLALLPSLSSQICNKLLPTRSSSSTSATVTTSTIFELASSQKALYNFKKLYSKLLNNQQQQSPCQQRFWD